MYADAQLIQEMTVTAVVTRCGCSAPLSHVDAVCPTPREEPVDLGVIGHWESPKE